MINEFKNVIPESGDWEAWYLNNKLIAEGHKVRVEDILDAIADIFPNSYHLVDISDERAEEGFPENFDDLYDE